MLKLQIQMARKLHTQLKQRDLLQMRKKHIKKIPILKKIAALRSL